MGFLYKYSHYVSLGDIIEEAREKDFDIAESFIRRLAQKIVKEKMIIDQKKILVRFEGEFENLEEIFESLPELLETSDFTIHSPV